MFKIYTKRGDNGTASLLFSNKRFKKSSPIFDVLGTSDELNVSLGYLQSSRLQEIKNVCIKIQRELFILGSYFAGKALEDKKNDWDKRIKELEEAIDYFDSKNEPLKSFILPGGSKESNYLHTSRVICRRLERLVVSYTKGKEPTILIVKYLNRLSDLLFVMARYSNKRLGYKDEIFE
ncbi:cob(I)yrinic acid a,c-diamide adenosyltransferase [Patescibacteria group bacterium]|nr:cob(I)yrinic acid a,c-diamide adenosyltransferase [Patescibacteria group bacterium]